MEVGDLSLTGLYLLPPVAHLQLVLDVAYMEHEHDSDSRLSMESIK